ncbi:MAG: hypothetical protein AB1758_14615 [Candidatus Eremiobacterota bacterium]
MHRFPPAEGSLEVVQVADRHHLGLVHALMPAIYADYPCWVPPLRLQFNRMLGSYRAPDRRLYLALRHGRPVARVAVGKQPQALHFGFFECAYGHRDAAAAVIEQAHSWAPHLPLRGPYHYKQEDPYTGLLVEGFDEQPQFLMPYHPPYYADYLASAGLMGMTDLFAYEFRGETAPVEVLYRPFPVRGIRVRPMDPWHRARDVGFFLDVFNDALSGNRGFERLEGAHARELFLLSFFILDPRWCFLALQDDRPVGALLFMPNYAPVLKKHGGRLTLPFVWDFLRCRRSPGSLRGYALGVVGDRRAGGVVTRALLHTAIPYLLENSITRMEAGWILADNSSMIRLAERFGGRRAKVYRILERSATTA